MKISNDLSADKIKYYTNVLIAGSLTIAPLIVWIQMNYTTKETLFITGAFLSILFIGRVCLEIGIFIESYFIDPFIHCQIRKKVNYYREFRECENVFNGNWYKYLMLDDNKAAKDIVAHMVERMLFLLSTMVGLIFGVIIYFIVFYKYASTEINIFVVLCTILYAFFSIKRSISLAAGLDFLRYIIINGDPCI